MIHLSCKLALIVRQYKEGRKAATGDKSRTHTHWGCSTRSSSLSSSSLLFFLLLVLILIAHPAEKLALIVCCCSPGEQLLSQGHIPSEPSAHHTHSGRHQSAAAAHPYACVLVSRGARRGVQNSTDTPSLQPPCRLKLN